MGKQPDQNLKTIPGISTLRTGASSRPPRGSLHEVRSSIASGGQRRRPGDRRQRDARCPCDRAAKAGEFNAGSRRRPETCHDDHWRYRTCARRCVGQRLRFARCQRGEPDQCGRLQRRRGRQRLFVHDVRGGAYRHHGGVVALSLCAAATNIGAAMM